MNAAAESIPAERPNLVKGGLRVTEHGTVISYPEDCTDLSGEGRLLVREVLSAQQSMNRAEFDAFLASKKGLEHLLNT